MSVCLFPFYDFKIISIDLISSVYEILLRKEKDKAFYTPEEYLTDYIVNRTVDSYLISTDECKILDTFCGSGILLVKLLQKILVLLTP